MQIEKDPRTIPSVEHLIHPVRDDPDDIKAVPSTYKNSESTELVVPIPIKKELSKIEFGLTWD